MFRWFNTITDGNSHTRKGRWRVSRDHGMGKRPSPFRPNSVPTPTVPPVDPIPEPGWITGNICSEWKQGDNAAFNS
jgi:hypothetical protein